MEMVVNAFSLNMASEEAIAPRQSMVGWLMRTVTRARSLPSHILAITSVDAA
jgi:hypothetical protein